MALRTGLAAGVPLSGGREDLVSTLLCGSPLLLGGDPGATTSERHPPKILELVEL